MMKDHCESKTFHYVVTVMINQKIIDVASFEYEGQARFYANKWDLDDGVIQIHRCNINQFRGSELITTIHKGDH